MAKLFPKYAYFCKRIIEQRTFSILPKRNICLTHFYSFLSKNSNQNKNVKKVNIFIQQSYRCLSSYSTGVQQGISALQAKKRIPRKKTVQLDDKVENTMSVIAFCTAEEYDLQSLSKAIINQGLYLQSDMPDDVQDVLHVSSKYQVDKEPSEMYFFREGSVVFWNVSETERNSVLKFLIPHSSHPYSNKLILEESECLNYGYAEENQHGSNRSRLVNGKILLWSEDSTDLEKYAFSNGMALSVKLAIWEASLNAFVESIEPMTEDMKNRKQISKTREEVFMKTAELYALRHIINLNSDLLDTPDFYWDRKNLENSYRKICNHLTISKRTKVMNEKLSHCCELMLLINDQMNDYHHVRLEIMIIILIAIEILFELIHIMN